MEACLNAFKDNKRKPGLDLEGEEDEGNENTGDGKKGDGRKKKGKSNPAAAPKGNGQPKGDGRRKRPNFKGV